MQIDFSNFLIAICAIALVALAVGVMIGFVIWQIRTKEQEKENEYMPKFYSGFWENGRFVIQITDDPDPEKSSTVIRVSEDGTAISRSGIGGPYEEVF